MTRYPHEEFDYEAIDEPAAEPLDPDRLEVARQVLDYLHTVVLAPGPQGRPASTLQVNVRWRLLRKLLGLDAEQSLADIARQCGCTRAWLSAAGNAMAKEFRWRGDWQRSDRVRETYRERALGVASGTWKATDHWERRKLRRAKQASVAAKSADANPAATTPGAKESFTRGANT